MYIIVYTYPGWVRFHELLLAIPHPVLTVTALEDGFFLAEDGGNPLPHRIHHPFPILMGSVEGKIYMKP